MRRRNVFAGAMTAMAGMVMVSGLAFGQQPGDMDAAKAASKAFYAALNTSAEAMHKVYAKTSYVVYVAPGSKAPVVGFDDVKKAIEASWAATTRRAVSISDQRIEVRGTLAWENGTKTGTVYLKDGAERKIDTIVTNIYEKIDGQWLMVSHHAQLKPQ